MTTFSEEDVQKHLFAVGLDAVLEDDEVRLEAATPTSSGALSEFDIPDFELWKLLKERALEKLRYLHDLTRGGEFIGAGINLPIDKTRHMFLDLLGTHEDGIFILELKINRAAERNAFTELLAYSNYISSLFPGSGEKDIFNILVAPIEAKIAKQAYLYDLLISDRNIVLYQPKFPDASVQSLRLSLYIPDDEEFQNFANCLLSHNAMACVVASFPDIPGWIEYDEENRSFLPVHTCDTLRNITSYAAQLMEKEGLHGFCFIRKRWHEIQMSLVGEERSELIICALNPFQLTDVDRTSLITSQLKKEDRSSFSEIPKLGFDGRLLLIAERVINDCIEENFPVEFETPYWGGMVTSMIETVFAHHLGFRLTGMLREAYVEHLAAMRRYNASFPERAVDVKRLQIDDIISWLRAWTFMEACGFVSKETS
ncbi:hypothetical protein AA14337_2685 [Acetobacter malorum DSM 14337]|uniref:DUF91 domain-containing protein n=1 Tax=Acetobacter malorum DSM 14337 TaxID=1307910 RepID=A0ABQ0PX38_9PROT|nr:hypothetical protein [Acetobacter malorum]KXV05188.1 hypothetical protein AD930_13710 [Acetobacter malorum]GBQ83802.1 hypothetical protein AA14337_2685 [Acetobacter malorum DSM 14337]